MSRYPKILGCLLLAASCAWTAVAAAEQSESPCLRMARERVTVLAGSRARTLDWHAAASCRSSMAVLEGASGAGPEMRESICRREVLAGAYTKTCIYFRDELCPDAFEPCKAWVMEQYEHCTSGDRRWFMPVLNGRDGGAP